MTRQPPTLHRNGDGTVKLHDYDVAIYLFAKRVPIHYAKQISRTKYEFCFMDPKHIADSLALEFVNGQSTLQPVEYADAQRRLKTVLHRFVSRR